MNKVQQAVEIGLIILLSSYGCNTKHDHGSTHWDEMNQQDLICDTTQERLGGVATWDEGKNWTIYDKELPRRTYVDKQTAMKHAEASLRDDCPQL